MDMVSPHERQLVPNWSPQLIVLSYCTSWLGSYTCTQLAVHAKYSKKSTAKWLWTLLGSVVFGFTAIWSMHFVGMLACRLDVNVKFDVCLTVLSAFVAVGSTFAVLSSAFVTEILENANPTGMFVQFVSVMRSIFGLSFGESSNQDLENGYVLLPTSEIEDDDVGIPSLNPAATEHEEDRLTSDIPTDGAAVLPPGAVNLQVSSTSTTSAGLLSTSCQTSSSDTCSDINGSVSHMNIDSRGENGLSWSKWFRVHYDSISIAVGIRAAIWGLGLGAMHYCGMWALDIPDRRISWDYRVVALSFLVAFVVCFVGCIAMAHMELHFGRQVFFSTLVAAGSATMHYMGMAAATVYTTAAPSPSAEYPQYLSFTIIIVAVLVCVVSNAVLAHSAIISRNRLEEMIVTRRRLWRIMAEKEAAEQANELKQQFISVASHEIRTPLHAVNGYCELLGMTGLTEEQKLYLTNIQQACHAINVIAGNVLDFSKLDRNNVELSARPVLVDLRKMLEQLALITETKGVQTGHTGVDVIVSVDADVPASVYIDEVYLFRILMNLLSNAQKFCESGHISVLLSWSASVTDKDEEKIIIKVIDTGCGIPHSFMPSLFQPYRQADTPNHARPRQGTGLGLSIVKHLVQRMEGTIDVVSVEGEGTTFTVCLPVTMPPPVPALSPSSPSLRLAAAFPPGPPHIPKRVKVVCHHARTTELFVGLWKRHGCTAVSDAVASDVASGSGMGYAELTREVDVVWTDVASVRAVPALRELLRDVAVGGAEGGFPMIYMVHTDVAELDGLDGLLGRGVVLVKKPVLMHAVVPMMMDPERYMRTKSTSTGARVITGAGVVEDPLTRDTRLHPGDVPLLMSPRDEGAPLGHRWKERVLLAEDNLVNQQLGKRLLEKLGYEVTTASNGQQAVDAIKTMRFICCLMDCQSHYNIASQMPVLDGFAATAKIRQMEENGTIHGRLPIIALTANVSPESEDKCRAAGMDYFLPKPLKMSDLHEIIRYAVSPR